jgi:hypothetical protein
LERRKDKNKEEEEKVVEERKEAVYASLEAERSEGIWY